ncbi:MAG: arsenite methyltransferase [Anaerolineae bacterium]|jgi:SAM-dependent methyltransferase
MSQGTMDETIKKVVRDAYGGIARRFVEEPLSSTGERASRASCCGPSPAALGSAEEKAAQTSCCGPSETSAEATTAASRFYSDQELTGLPDSVTGASLGCGNPVAIAGLQPGEVVLDLGSGGGIDCFLAAEKVGPEGRVIGLDMTPDMIKLARRNAKKVGATNIDFRFGEMEDMPLPDAWVDVIISNCVINLSPDKDAVFREAYRVLRPGGRLNVSDIVVDGDLPQPIRENLDAWAGCVAGALDESDYLDKIRAAGFEKVEILSRGYVDIEETTEWEEVQAMAVREDDEVIQGEEMQALLTGAGLSPHDLSRKVASIKVRAYKPA